MDTELIILIVALAIWVVSILDEKPLIAAIAFLVLLGTVAVVLDLPAADLVAGRVIRLVKGVL